MVEKKEIEIQESLGKLISCIYRYCQIYLGKELRQYKIGSGQFSFLMALYVGDGIHQEYLAHSLKVDKATCARAIKKLVDEGYVVREEDPVDKRAYKVFLTEKGKKMNSIFKKISSEWTGLLFSEFTENEKKSVMTLLKKMVYSASSIK